jgi:class 3 adenylate cyclase/TolB-like protein
VVGSGHLSEEPHWPHAVEWANRAVLLVDIAESVRLMEQDEAGVISRWLGLVEYARSRILPEFGGHLVKSLGDGMLLDFPDVRSAVSTALAIQQASDQMNFGRPPEQQILLRMGIEISDIIVEPDDVHGRGVNLAARLMTLAGPGEIVISANARDQLTPNLDADIEDLGDCFLRHLSRPVRAYRVGLPGPRPVIKPAVSLGDLAPAIAVVPFAPRDARPEHNLIGEVMAEEIISALSRSSELNVISRLSTTVFRGRNVTIADIGAHLDADYVLSGAFSSDEHDLTLDAELAEVKSGRIIWSDRLTDRISGLLSGERALIGHLVARIGAAVTTRELQRSRLQPLPTLKAYTLLLSAIALMHRLSPRDFEQARHLLQTLIDRGVTHPIPLAWLADWHVLRVQQGWSDDQRKDAYLALECTKRALDLDPTCSLALAVDGFAHTNLLKKLDVAEERYDLAIQSNPNDALAWLLKGTLHAFKGEGRQAVADTQRALKLSPLDPRRYFYDSLAATACLAAHQFADALMHAQRSLRANRTHTSTLRAMAIAQWNLGLHEEARKTGAELMTLEPTLTIERWRERSPSALFAIGEEWARTLREIGVPSSGAASQPQTGGI